MLELDAPSRLCFDRYVPFATPLSPILVGLPLSPLVTFLARRLSPDLIWPLWHVALHCLEWTRLEDQAPQEAQPRRTGPGLQSPNANGPHISRQYDKISKQRIKTCKMITNSGSILSTCPFIARCKADVKPSKDQTQSVWHQLRVLAFLVRRLHRFVVRRGDCEAADPWASGRTTCLELSRLHSHV